MMQLFFAQLESEIRKQVTIDCYVVCMNLENQ